MKFEYICLGLLAAESIRYYVAKTTHAAAAHRWFHTYGKVPTVMHDGTVATLRGRESDFRDDSKIVWVLSSSNGTFGALWLDKSFATLSASSQKTILARIAQRDGILANGMTLKQMKPLDTVMPSKFFEAWLTDGVRFDIMLPENKALAAA